MGEGQECKMLRAFGVEGKELEFAMRRMVVVIHASTNNVNLLENQAGMLMTA